MARTKKLGPKGIRVIFRRAKDKVLAATADGGARAQVG